MRTIAAWAMVLTGGLLATRAAAQDMDLPVATQIPLFLKVLTFDRQLHARAGAEIVVGIAYQSGNHVSADTKDDATKVFAATHELDGIPMRVVAIDLDHEALLAALARAHVLVLYVAPLRAVDLPSFTNATRKAHVTTVTGVAGYVSMGLAVGARLQGDKPKLFVNLTAARAEGADFSAELLKLAQVMQ